MPHEAATARRAPAAMGQSQECRNTANCDMRAPLRPLEEKVKRGRAPRTEHGETLARVGVRQRAGRGSLHIAFTISPYLPLGPVARTVVRSMTLSQGPHWQSRRRDPRKLSLGIICSMSVSLWSGPSAGPEHAPRVVRARDLARAADVSMAAARPRAAAPFRRPFPPGAAPARRPSPLGSSSRRLEPFSRRRRR